jgi:hypothetical protein
VVIIAKEKMWSSAMTQQPKETPGRNNHGRSRLKIGYIPDQFSILTGLLASPDFCLKGM